MGRAMRWAGHLHAVPVPMPKSGLGRARAAMLQQPRVPPTGQRQAIEIAIKWREVLAQKEALLKIMSRHTGHSVDKLDKVRYRAQVIWHGLH